MTFEAKCSLIKDDLRMLVTLEMHTLDEEEAYKKASSVLYDLLGDGWNLVNFYIRKEGVENE